MIRFFLLLTIALTGFSAAAAAAERGAVLEIVNRNAAGVRSGLRDGDVVIAWERAAAPPANPALAAGEIKDPFDLDAVELEQSSRGVVTLTVERAGGRVAITLTPGAWGVRAQPVLSAGLEASHRQSQSLVTAGRADDATAAWRALANGAQGTTAVWFLLRGAEALADAKSPAPSDTLFGEALSRASAEGPLAAAHVLDAWAQKLERRLDWPAAEERYRQSLAENERRGASLAVVNSLRRLAWLSGFQGRVAARREFLQRALHIAEDQAPAGDVLGAILRDQTAALRYAGELDAAEKYGLRAVKLYAALMPGTLPHAASENEVALVWLERGDLEAAEAAFRRTLAIWKEKESETRPIAILHSQLSGVAIQRGDLIAAEEHLRRTLSIFEKVDPGGIELSLVLGNLGFVAMRRRDWVEAQEWLDRAGAIQSKLAPGSPPLAVNLYCRGVVAHIGRGDLDEARRLLEEARVIQEKVAPESGEHAQTRCALGLVYAAQGDLAAAEREHERALAIHEKRVPNGLDTAVMMQEIADVALQRGQEGRARELYTRALAIQQKLAPGTDYEAQSLHALGDLERRAGRLEAAGDLFCRAVDALERQGARLGSTSDVRAGFTASFADFYQDCLAVHVALGRRDEAFRVLERSRARELVKLLAERDLVAPESLPSDLREEQARLGRDHDRIQARLMGRRPLREPEALEEAAAQLRDIGERRERLRAEVRRRAPRVADLRDPEPFDRPAAQALLEDGTVLLSYSVGREKTLLFGLSSSRLAVFEIALGRDALRARVDRFRRLIDRGRLQRRVDPALLTEGAALFGDLVGPAVPLLEEGRRLLVSPDGPLHALPFGALVRGSARGRPTYLVEWRPTHTVVSMGVYGTLRAARTKADPWTLRLAAFGAPEYPAAASSASPDVVLRSAVRRGLTLDPLPATREEVKRIAAGMGAKSATFLGAKATEEQVKETAPQARYLHFACHAYLDRLSPLNSALVLTIPAAPAEGRDNGLLQAWEIFEKLRIDADLVTLSACETALGKEMGGEGLIGLTRAFQYAGARSIVASLWRVSDRSTADLMPRFYRHLRAGKPKDEALQAAQVELIRRRPHPFHWAAFEVIGDWR